MGEIMKFLTRRSDREMIEIFRKFSRELRSTSNLKEVLRGVLRFFCEAAGCSSGNIFLHDESTRSLSVQASMGGEPPISNFNIHDLFIHYLVRTQTPIFKNQLINDRRMIDIKEPGIRFFTSANAEAVFPMKVEEKFVGLLALGGRREEDFSARDLEPLNILVPIASICVENALLCDAFAKQNLRLSELAKLKTQFINTISHELSTPLNGILGLTEVLLDSDNRDQLNHDHLRYLEMIQSAGKELREVVQHILTLVKFQNKRQDLLIKKIDVSRTLETTLLQYQEQLEQKNVQVNIEWGNPPPIYGDEEQIGELFQCLVDNAVKFSLENQPNQLGFQASRQGEMLKICVYDGGIGIREKEQEKIFEDFSQADAELTREYGGAGLGLALAKKIVELHGVRIWVESKKNAGAKFFFTLPLKPSLVNVQELDLSS